MYTVLVFWLLSLFNDIYQSIKTTLSCLGELKSWYNFLCQPRVVTSVKVAITTTTAAGDSTTKSVLVTFDQPGPISAKFRESKLKLAFTNSVV